jgi:beta-glucosidase
MIVIRNLLIIIILYFPISIVAETISGRVLDSLTSVPIPSATIRLTNQNIETYSDANGAFSLVFTPSSVKPSNHSSRTNSFSITSGTLNFSLEQGKPVVVQIFDIQGRRIRTLLKGHFNCGDHLVSIYNGLKNIGSGLHVVAIRIGGDTYIRSFLPLGLTDARNSLINPDRGSRTAANTFSSLDAPDNLQVSRMGYTGKTVPIASYASQNIGDVPLNLTAEEKNVQRKADSLLALMGNTEKAGQMVMVLDGQMTNAQLASNGIGGAFNGPAGDNTPATWAARIDGIQVQAASTGPHKIPILYGMDCVHGVGFIAGMTVFPHNIGLGCTGDTALIAKIGKVVASEAAGCGIRLNFAPCVSVVRNEKWGRTYEGFGETPEINTAMGAAYTRGLQGDGNPSADTSMIACPKHYFGDGGTANGINMGMVPLADSSMRGIHLPPYLACVREQMGSVMPSYTKWVRPGGPEFGMTFDSVAYRMLKKDAGFDGFALSDWNAIVTPNACGSYSNSCVAQAINAGLDMAMIPSGTDAMTFIASVASQAGSAIPQSRIDDAVRRILRIKFRFNIFAFPRSNGAARARIFSAGHQAIAREAVRKSCVLLRNVNNALPLKKDERITVVGPFANDIGVQCGGWTISWQGQPGPGPGIAGQTVLAGMQSVGTAANITYNANGTGLVAANIDKIVVVVGELPYSEGVGDTINQLDLTKSNNAANLIASCYGTGKPVIAVLLSGRPMCIEHEMDQCAAFVCAWLPGSMGIGVADVLYGDYNFSGTLTHSWPANYAQIPINTGKVYSEEQKGNGGNPLYQYGYGLKY